jgi:hypothetical protein
MSYEFVPPNTATNLLFDGDYEALDDLDASNDRYLKNEGGALVFKAKNTASGPLELDGSNQIPASYLAGYLRLTGNNPSLNPITGNISSNASIFCLGLGATLISSPGPGVALNTSSSINFVDADAVNKRLTLADRVDTAVLASQNGTAALTIPASGAVQVSDARGLQCSVVSHPTAVSLIRGSAYVKVQNVGNFIEIQGTNSGPMYVNSSNYVQGVNGTYSMSASSDVTLTSGWQMNLVGVGVQIQSGSVTFPSLPTGTGTDLVLNGTTLTRNTSSLRYKDNVRPLEVDTSKVFDLQPKSFHYKGQSKEIFGMIAEEVHEVLPEMVNLNEKDEPESISYSLLSVLLLEEIKKLKQRLDAAGL